MRILHVVDQISQTLHGGSAKVPYQLAKAQAKLGHEVSIYSSDYQAKDQQPPEGVKLYKFHCVLNLLGGVKITPGMFAAPFGYYNIIHLHNYRTFVNLMSVIQLVPYVLQAHGSASPLKARTTKQIHKFIWQDLILKRAERLIADAESEIEQYKAEGGELEKIRLIPVGIDLDEFKNLPPKQFNSHKTILFLGRLDKIKGIDLLLKAFKLMDNRNTRLVIAGPDYGYESEARRMVEDLKLQDSVQFAGPLYGRDKIQAYVNADVFVLPSSYEMWGLTFMEALACGTPVVMTDRCEAAKVLPEECGIVSRFDELNLAGALNDVLLDTNIDRYRNARQAWVSKYSWEGIAKQTIQLYSEVLTDKCLNRS